MGLLSGLSEADYDAAVAMLDQYELVGTSPPLTSPLSSHLSSHPSSHPPLTPPRIPPRIPPLTSHLSSQVGTTERFEEFAAVLALETGMSVHYQHEVPEQRFLPVRRRPTARLSLLEKSSTL